MSDHQPDHPAEHRSGHDHHVVRADTVANFLSGRRIAVVGASDDPKNFGRTIYHELREHGYEPVAVHPSAVSVDGDACYPDIAAVPGVLEQSIEGVPSVTASGECLAIDNTFHPANSRLNLATAVKNLIACFGISWNEAKHRNGHFAPFAWSGSS